VIEAQPDLRWWRSGRRQLCCSALSIVVHQLDLWRMELAWLRWVVSRLSPRNEFIKFMSNGRGHLDQACEAAKPRVSMANASRPFFTNANNFFETRSVVETSNFRYL